ncbi:hypothetical protein XA68_13155 [Ophiocordyceps unilateralis]|uniref:Uncharacterized protein n=1 Tax=Ophiocordyceps unilateralis TaxID=268505 RepID=A0A2A9PBR0_OPHUN|nr:hypothetical protein XA68_13155 [Ophiocordyceps unilateralis]
MKLCIIRLLWAGIPVFALGPVFASRTSDVKPWPIDVPNITYSCGLLEPLEERLGDCSEEDARAMLSDSCGALKRFQNIRYALPPAFTQMLKDKMNLTSDEIRRHLRNSFYNCGRETTYQRLRWFESDGRNRTVCWPDQPDFTYHDFEEFGGVLAALFLRPETLRWAVPQRFMDLPPGFLSKHRVHYIFRASYNYKKLRRIKFNFRVLPVLGHDTLYYPGLKDVRDLFDVWGGRVGRLLFAAMRKEGGYSCSYQKGCVIDWNKRPGPGEPFQPKDHTWAIDHWLKSLGSNKPFAITFGPVSPDFAPQTLWLSVG